MHYLLVYWERSKPFSKVDRVLCDLAPTTFPASLLSIPQQFPELPYLYTCYLLSLGNPSLFVQLVYIYSVFKTQCKHHLYKSFLMLMLECKFRYCDRARIPTCFNKTEVYFSVSIVALLCSCQGVRLLFRLHVSTLPLSA